MSIVGLGIGGPRLLSNDLKKEGGMIEQTKCFMRNKRQYDTIVACDSSFEREIVLI